MTGEEALFFNGAPGMLTIYMGLRDRIIASYPDVVIKVSKSQISFYNRHLFAMASLPRRRVKAWPKEYLMVSFGLADRVDSPRIVKAVEPYPGRWTHHVLCVDLNDIDDELMMWIDAAYSFSMVK